MEGALYGAGLLTAWVHPDPALTEAALASAEADGYLIPTAPVGGRTLADVLLPEEQEHVAPSVITAMLRSVALTDEIAGATDIAAIPVVIGSPYRAPEYGRLLAAARRSLERTGGDLTGAVSVPGPSDAERKAIIGLTGEYRDARAAQVSVGLTDLGGEVRETTGRGLPELLTEMGGPLRNRPAERSALAAARDAAVGAARASALHDACDWYRDWLAEIAADGTLTRLIGQGEQARLRQAVCVLEHLAERGGAPVLLPALAADVTGIPRR